jgi:transcriptional regulator with XRE-family HTH domain/tetratricopeptide (TPR) repeat protein
MKKSSHPLRSARTRYNLTIEQLAREASVSAATIWRAEHNHSINAESRRRLCAYFDMTALDLGLIDGESPQLQPAHLNGQKLAGMQEFSALQRTPDLVTGASIAGQVGHPHISASALQEPLNEKICPEERPEQPGLWLLLSVSHLATLFESDWGPDSLVEAMRILLPCLMGIPGTLRMGLLQEGFSHTIGHKKCLSAQERFYMQQSFSESIRLAWQFYHVARPIEIMAVAQAQQRLLQYVRPLLPGEMYASYYSSIQNLVGGVLYLLDQLEDAEHVHGRAYQAAKEAGDYQNQVQSRNWQAIDANRHGKYLQAIRYIEDALNLIDSHPEPELLCSKAHLLANWAFNAAHLQEFAEVEEKLTESAKLLEFPNPDGEFDQAIWYQIAGKCLLLNGHYTRAIDHFHRSLSMLTLPWHTRRSLTLIPLAEAYARKREKEASLAAATEAASTVHTVNATMLVRYFMEYRQILVETFPHDQSVRAFISRVTPQIYARGY